MTEAEKQFENDLVSIDRVIVNKEGEAWPLGRAILAGKMPDIMFKRKDGWILAAPKRFTSLAYCMWREEWTHFARRGDLVWRDIKEFLP